ncbi:S1C family serine protease [Geofilum sp. OHC36d9]|uniref:S1C family serine protease n=1 Tax=Geofilum sp. OHC36d9 TaxID=3458413 RepID=UPI0040346002
MKNRTYQVVGNILMGLLFIITLHSLSGCSGCSPSGRRSHQKASSTTNYSSNTTDRQRHQNTETRVIENTVRQVLPLNELYNKYKKSVFLVYTSDGNNEFQGSGFFVSKNGLAVSNYHVFEGTSQGLEIIETLDGKQFKVKEVLEKSEENDYIIFRVNIGSYNILNPIPVVSQIPEIGDDVFAIGNPRGLQSTLSKGIVSAFRENNSLIQTTTEITHGSSGGPLLNMMGEVIGITTSGLGEANLNFAVNIKYLKLYRFL